MTSKSAVKKTFYKITLLLFVLCIPVVAYFINKKANPGRVIASEDASSLEEFQKSFKHEILKNMEVVRHPQGPALKFRAEAFVCEMYPTLDLYFIADGMALSGESPQMLLRFPCLSSADGSYILGFAIPFEEIARAPVNKFEFSAYNPATTETGKIYFRNIPDNWPTHWTWTGMTFHGKKTEEKLKITGYEVISVLGQPLILKMNSNE